MDVIGSDLWKRDLFVLCELVARLGLLKDITQEDFVIQDINFEVIEFATMF